MVQQGFVQLWIVPGSNIFAQEDKSFDAHDYVKCELGFQERYKGSYKFKIQTKCIIPSVDTVVKAWQGGTYDGIFAFSQVVKELVAASNLT